MPTDLWYFSESYLDKGNLTKFHDFLPKHLRKMFIESMGGYKEGGNVLQGYRGPHNNGSSGDSQNLSAIDGLQEVKYWWGLSKHYNWIPFAGTLAYGIARAAGDTKWHSLYFDSKTEECLSHDKELAVEKLNDMGRKLYDSGKFAEAEEYFNNANSHFCKLQLSVLDVSNFYKPLALLRHEVVPLNFFPLNSWSNMKHMFNSIRP